MPELRIRLLAAALTATAALTLTACNDGQGLRDEGPSSTAGARDPIDMPLRRGARQATTAPHQPDDTALSAASVPLPWPNR